jgi:dienelactone hydrolase
VAALALLGSVAAAVGVIFAVGGAAPAHKHRPTAITRAAATPHPTGAPPSGAPFAVGLRVLRLVDRTRTVHFPDGTTEPRTLLTYVRYPALGAGAGGDVRGARAASGPFPLVIFGHGFAVLPASYERLLRAWTRAGYVVAAPVFPLGNANAPGGPNETDLANQPADMRFVISSMEALSETRSGPLAGLIDPARIAVSGHSDGGDTALAVAYDPPFRDPRVGAAVILSGAEIPGLTGFTFPSGSPPLLAVQGTADTVNPPSFTDTFFEAARRPRYLLSLLGAEHLPPYSDQQPQLAIVERVTIAFLDRYLKHSSAAARQLIPLASVAGVATMRAEG